MDRFKFRVWSVEEKSYDHKFPFNSIGLFYVAQNGHLFSDFGNAVAPEIHDDKFIIEQCTGLRDKNGNLIYENDRVGFYVYGQDEKWHAQQGTVIWYNSCWGVETSSRFIQFENELTIKDPKDIEIIGNIHQIKD